MTTEQIKRHYDAIASRYGIAKISSFLIAARRYECELHRLAVIMCNESRLYEWATECFAYKSGMAMKNLSKYCEKSKKFESELYFNRDPRGYAIKIEADDLESGLWTDWGGYGIVAPSKIEN